MPRINEGMPNEQERDLQETMRPSEEEVLASLEPTVEEEFGSEVFKEIMDKVQDIDEYGTAYHVMTNVEDLPGVLDEDRDARPWKERLEDLLRHGLLGTAHERMGTASKVNPKKWLETTRKQKRGEVMFNIVGREFAENSTTEIERQEGRERGETWIESGSFMWQDSNKIAIIFDLSKFKEVEPRKGEDLSLPKSKTFHVDSIQTKKNDRGEVMAQSDYGFSLYPRVPPNIFKGIVFKATRKHTEQEIIDYLKMMGDTSGNRLAIENAETKEDNPKMLEKRAEEVVLIMRELYKDKPHLMVPIYDVHGNLYWPEKLSHSELRKSGEKSVEPNKESQEEKRYSSTVLEIGCGSMAAPWLQDNNLAQYANAHIILTDIKHKAVKGESGDAEKRVRDLGDKFTGKVDGLVSDAKRLPFESDTMNEVYIANVFGEPGVAEKQKIMEEGSRVLAENGELIVVEWVTPDVALGLSSSQIYSEQAWKDAFASFGDQFKKFGLEIKTIEWVKYDSALSTMSVVDAETAVTVHEAVQKRLEQLPYAKKFIGGLIIPQFPNQHKFIIVFKKVNPEK